MASQRKQYSAEFKAKVALEAIRGQKTINELASEYSVHPTQIGLWKKDALEGLASLFETQRGPAAAKAQAELTARLYQQIGQLQVELDWLKKKIGS
jgi:putative transposase